MIRLIGLVLIAATGVGAGIYASLVLRKRVECLELCSRFVQWMDTRIRYSAAPVGELLLEAEREPEFRTLPFLGQAADKIRRGTIPVKAWEQALAEEKSGWLTSQDRELLSGFGSGLGKTDVEGQRNHCRYFAGRLEDSLRSARAEASAKGRLYVSLGIMGGAGLSLLLI